jgi:hypothetical protein
MKNKNTEIILDVINKEIEWCENNKLILSDKELLEAENDIVKVIKKNFILGLKQAIYLIKKI